MTAAAASAWATFYEGRSGADYLAYARIRYAPFIETILTSIQSGDTALELGAGTGTITKALLDARAQANLVASDIDPEMRRMAMRRLGSAVDVIDIDATRAPTLRADVVHSHGMLEHFDDDTIRKVIRTHGHARTQVHYVPGLYDTPSFGDERLMSVADWWRICEPDQILTFNGGLDYALIFGRRA
ncbi:class I SAM-dependent methyltransferase [Bradyrhizobium sp. SZCCHNS3053]|uniref:class I SAM-dependent methyltransferase n=1 Tax=Bradyrhizobium sp. SZCCHNS3053 TaxID=3057322 RepID=UPI0029160569|nr:class I SAM-dependent methyltransferase [Bradyrhizobium sp. SZCCHNS3053]